jgi:hypothetical protein
VLTSLYEDTEVEEEPEELFDEGEANWPSLMEVEDLFDVIKQALSEWRQENPNQRAPIGEEFLYAKIQKKLGRPMVMPEIDLFEKEVRDGIWSGYFDMSWPDEDDSTLISP